MSVTDNRQTDGRATKYSKHERELLLLLLLLH